MSKYTQRWSTLIMCSMCPLSNDTLEKVTVRAKLPLQHKVTWFLQYAEWFQNRKPRKTSKHRESVPILAFDIWTAPSVNWLDRWKQNYNDLQSVSLLHIWFELILQLCQSVHEILISWILIVLKQEKQVNSEHYLIFNQVNCIREITNFTYCEKFR